MAKHYWSQYYFAVQIDPWNVLKAPYLSTLNKHSYFSLSANLENLALDPFQLRFRSSSFWRTHNSRRQSWRWRPAETAISTWQRASVLNLDVNGCFSMADARATAVNCSMYVISFTTGWSKHSNIYILSTLWLEMKWKNMKQTLTCT